MPLASHRWLKAIRKSVDGCNCAETLELICQGKIDTTWLITHKYPLSSIEEAYKTFENRLDNVIKTAIYPN